jgi:hypothetical protein
MLNEQEYIRARIVYGERLERAEWERACRAAVITRRPSKLRIACGRLFIHTGEWLLAMTTPPSHEHPHHWAESESGA